jgi:Glycosyl hydrolases family 16
MEGSPGAFARRATLLTMLVLVACGNAPARLANASSSSTAVGTPTWSALPSPWVPSLPPTIAPTPTAAPTHAPATHTPSRSPATARPTSSGGGGGGGGGTNVVFADNFSGNSVDTSKWLVQNGGRGGNGEMQCYSAANTTAGGGVLTETAKVDASCNNGGYSSGAIQSHFTFTYGTVSVRARMAGGIGPWPAIWLLGHNCQPWRLSPNGCQPPWPQPGSDEIDFGEILNSNHNAVWQQVHMSSGSPGCYPSASDVSQNWHTYTLVWVPGKLTWKIDGSTTCTDTSAVPSQAMFLIINTAVGGSGGTPNNGTLPQKTTISSVTITR